MKMNVTSVLVLSVLLTCGCGEFKSTGKIERDTLSKLDTSEERQPPRTKEAENTDNVLEEASELFIQGKDQASIEVLEEFLKQYPNQPRVLIKLGEIYFNTGEREKALLNLNKAIELDPHSGWANRVLGLLYKSEKKYELAQKYSQSAVEQSPDEGDKISALADLVEIYLCQGKNKLAKEKYKLLLNLSAGKQIYEQRLAEIKELFDGK